MGLSLNISILVSMFLAITGARKLLVANDGEPSKGLPLPVMIPLKGNLLTGRPCGVIRSSKVDVSSKTTVHVRS